MVFSLFPETEQVLRWVACFPPPLPKGHFSSIANTGLIRAEYPYLWMAGAHTRNSLHICRQTCSRTGVNLSAASRSDYRREYLHVCLPCRIRQHINMVSKIQIFSALTQNGGEAGNLHREFLTF